MGAFDGDGRGEETGVFDDGGVEGVGMSDKGRGKEAGIFENKGEVSVSDDGGAEEVGAFDERGGKEMGRFDKRGVSDDGGVEEAGAFDERGGKEMGRFDTRGVSDDGGAEEVGAFDERGGKEMGRFDTRGVSDDEGAEEVGAFDERGGKEMGRIDKRGVSDDGGVEEAGAFDEGGAEEVGASDESRGKEVGIFDKRGRAGVPDEDVDEIGVWDCEDGAEVDGTTVDAGGRIQLPRRSKPRGHVALGGEEVWGLLVTGAGVGVESEEDGGSLVCAGGAEDELPGNSPSSTLTELRGSDEDGVVVVGAVVAGELSGAVLVDGGDDEVPPGSGKKMAPGKSGKELEE